MKPSWMSPNMYTPVVNDRCNSDRTGENVGHANTHRYGKTISYIDGIKGLRTNCRLASCFVSYVNEHQSDYHGIIWFTFLELLVQCAVNPLLIGGFPYRRSIAWNCVVWLMHFALLVAHWCLIKSFHIADPMCGVSICSNPHHKRTEAVMSSFMFFPNELLNKQWRCKWVENSWNSDYVTVMSFVIQ